MKNLLIILLLTIGFVAHGQSLYQKYIGQPIAEKIMSDTICDQPFVTFLTHYKEIVIQSKSTKSMCSKEEINCLIDFIEETTKSKMYLEEQTSSEVNGMVKCYRTMTSYAFYFLNIIDKNESQFDVELKIICPTDPLTGDIYILKDNKYISITAL